MNAMIEKSTDINAQKEKVWEVLLNDRFTRIWYAAFGEGSRAETDWKKGSKAVFTDGSGRGIIGKVVENKPHQLISLSYEGVINNGEEDYESEKAQDVKDFTETYRLSENNGRTTVQVECYMDEKYYDSMSLAWDEALTKVKELSERPSW